MKHLPLIALLLLTGCAETKTAMAVKDWATLIQPSDPPPEECTQPPAPEPKMADRAYTKKESARADRSVRLWGRAVSRQLKGCQTWAKGQRA